MFLKTLPVVALSVLLLASPAFAKYPDKPITGYIPFGAGGGVDISARTISPPASALLGQTIIMQNKPGATGAIGLTTVANLPADGYSLLFSAENPNLYKILGLSKLDYSNFEPVLLIMSNPGLIVVPKNSPYNTVGELVNAVRKGKKINMGTAGPGSLAHVANTILQKAHDIKFNQVQFDGEGPGITAIMGGHLDGMVAGLISAANYVDSGSLKCLAVLSNERLDTLPDIPAITEEFPEEYGPYLPWGPFYGVYVKKGCPPDVLNTLREAFVQASASDQFQNFIKDIGGISLGITGEEATAYIEHNQSISAWLLYDTGGAKFSPEDFGIKRLVKGE